MIVPLTIETLDNKEMLAMGELFYRESRLPGKFNVTSFIQGWSCILVLKYGQIWIALDNNKRTIGAIGGLIHPDICSGDMVAQEMFWFMHPDHRNGMTFMKLYHAFETWAKESGAIRICMANTFNEHTEKLRHLYLKMNFRPVDVSYFKTL